MFRAYSSTLSLLMPSRVVCALYAWSCFSRFARDDSCNCVTMRDGKRVFLFDRMATPTTYRSLETFLDTLASDVALILSKSSKRSIHAM